jgi:HEAT repeat protein
MALEAVFILTELASDAAIAALADFARDINRDPELRAAAVWGLGKSGADRPDLLVDFIGNDDDLVALHAIAAVGELSPDLIKSVAAHLGNADRPAASAMAVLSRQGVAGARALLDAARDNGQFNVWALAGLGEMDPEVVRTAAGGKLDDDIAARVEPMWARDKRSWINDNEPTGPLSFLERQTIRHAPPDVTDTL